MPNLQRARDVLMRSPARMRMSCSRISRPGKVLQGILRLAHPCIEQRAAGGAP